MVYLLLAGSGLTVALYVISRSGCRARYLALFVSAASVIMLADWIAYGWFHLYEYEPTLPLSKWADDAMGEFLADIVFVPSLIVILVRHAPGALGVILGTLIVTAIEYTFIEHGIFIHHGWQLWHSAVLFPIYFWAMDYYWRILDEVDVTTGWQAKQLRLGLVFDAVALLALYYRAERLVETNIHIMPTYTGNQSLGRFLGYALVTVPLGYWFLSCHGAARWGRLILATLAMTGINYLLPALNLQFYQGYLTPSLDAIFQGVAIAAAALAQDAIDRMAHSEDRWRPPVLPRGRV